MLYTNLFCSKYHNPSYFPLESKMAGFWFYFSTVEQVLYCVTIHMNSPQASSEVF